MYSQQVKHYKYDNNNLNVHEYDKYKYKNISWTLQVKLNVHFNKNHCLIWIIVDSSGIFITIFFLKLGVSISQ